MHPRARRALSVLLSAAVHALLLLEVYSWTVMRPGFPEQPVLPVRIIDAPRPPQQAKKAAPKPPPQQVAVAKPPEAAKPAEEAKPVEEPPPPAPEPPQRKLPVPEQQIVSPSEEGKNEAPPNTRLLSDRDNRVDQQMVKKGNPAPGEEAPGPKNPKPAPAPKQDKPADRRGGGKPQRQPPPQVAALPSLDRLMPNALRLAEENYATQPAAQPGEQIAQADQPRRLRQAGSDGLWIPSSGPIGTLDFLPDVKEGDITLLNTKAEVFAPFVRRVAIRVFQNFLISLKRDLASSALATTETVEAEAIMDVQGEMVDFNVNQRSARISLASDRRLQQACNDGFFDRNPPPGARAKDGRIHFILRTAVQSAPTPRGNAYWVQLEAGLL
jgi:hypothetical protein